MNISYDVTLDDVVEFNRYHWQHSVAIRRVHRRSMLLMAPLTGALVLASALVGGLIPPLFLPVVLAFACGVVGYWITDVLWRRFWLGWMVRKIAAEGGNKTTLGRHELLIASDGVTERTAFGESRQTWPAIERVVESERYIFIYTQPLAAHIIPKAAFADPEAAARFLAEARRLHEQAIEPHGPRS